MGPLLVHRLQELLGPRAVTACDVVDEDVRTREHVSGRSIGTPLVWVRPDSTDEVAVIVRLARELGASVTPVGAATTFWDGLRVSGAIALDTLSLRAPFVIDADARSALVGAGVSVRELDRAARAHGLCVASRPDSSGDTPLGSLLSIGSTAGLGMGYGLALEQVTAATAVTGRAETARFGASHLLHGLAYAAHGLPHGLGLLAAAEGRGAIVTEVGVRLRRAPHVAMFQSARATAPSAPELVELLAEARATLDHGALDTLRVELGHGARGVRLEVMGRTFDDRSVEAAQAHARALRERLERHGLVREAARVETDAARRGEGPDYEMHWSSPAGETRTRLLGGAFWGAEITVPWGPRLEAALTCALHTFDALGAAAPLHRRFAVYPGHHMISIGVQVLGRREPAAVEQVRGLLAAALPEWLEHGVPYRAGALWRDALDRALDADDRRGTRALLESFFRAMDPDSIIGSASVGAFARASS